ncbi:FMN-dependent dehydrogenase-domain-containing protein [Aspergillus leporis]|uniref:FMN-dependent dehydrogenase-domain-containing protein n=1 Tax=Aspergillus leporis TaxID=41062 RepID=A0A5N5WXB6_9EURO|nr:FMN-dependent dehydrogenase-domain-containing protein [Aspergillus leporis]
MIDRFEVYDVTSFINDRPGGSAAILALAGKDATKDYRTIHPLGLFLRHAWANRRRTAFITPKPLQDRASRQAQTQRSIPLRPRVFIDCRKCDLSTEFLGLKLGLPIYVSPAAMARLARPSGEAGIAAACKRFKAMLIISHSASMTTQQLSQTPIQTTPSAGNSTA